VPLQSLYLALGPPSIGGLLDIELKIDGGGTTAGGSNANAVSPGLVEYIPRGDN
jgi:hypothetical protein